MLNEKGNWIETIREMLGDMAETSLLLKDDSDSIMGQGEQSIYTVLDVKEVDGEVEVELKDNFNGEILYGSLEKLMFEKRYQRILMGMDPLELARLALLASVIEVRQTAKLKREVRIPNAAWVLFTSLMEPESEAIH